MQRKLLASILASLLVIAQSAGAGVTSTPSVARNSDGTVNLSVQVSDTATVNQFYIAAIYQGKYYFLKQTSGGVTWSAWDTGNLQDIPSYHALPVTLTTAQFSILDHIDVATLPGLKIYAGTGSDPADMVARNNFKLAFDAATSLPPATPACTGSCISFSVSMKYEITYIDGTQSAPSTSSLSGTLANLSTLTMTASNGCTYSGTLHPSSYGISGFYTGSATASGCSNSVYNGKYSTVTLVKSTSGYSLIMLKSSLMTDGYIVSAT